MTRRWRKSSNQRCRSQLDAWTAVKLNPKNKGSTSLCKQAASSSSSLGRIRYSQHLPSNQWTWVPTREYVMRYTKPPKASLCAPFLVPWSVAHMSQTGFEHPEALSLRKALEVAWPEPAHRLPKALMAQVRAHEVSGCTT